MLKAVAETLAGRFRGSDVVARMGGEEFSVVVNDVEACDAGALFDEVREAVAARVVDYQGVELNVTISVGVCTVLAPNIEEMLNRADALLYQAKEGGRNRVVCDLDGAPEDV